MAAGNMHHGDGNMHHGDGSMHHGEGSMHHGNGSMLHIERSMHHGEGSMHHNERLVAVGDMSNYPEDPSGRHCSPLARAETKTYGRQLGRSSSSEAERIICVIDQTYCNIHPRM